MSDRLVKDGGWCAQCSRSDIGVAWHPGSRKWYCTDCWPALKDRHEERRIANLPSAGELSRTRDRLYGFRIEDDPNSRAAFVAICPEHGTIGGDLTMAAGRRLRDNHVIESH